METMLPSRLDLRAGGWHTRGTPQVHAGAGGSCSSDEEGEGCERTELPVAVGPGPTHPPPHLQGAPRGASSCGAESVSASSCQGAYGSTGVARNEAGPLEIPPAAMGSTGQAGASRGGALGPSRRDPWSSEHRDSPARDRRPKQGGVPEVALGPSHRDPWSSEHRGSPVRNRSPKQGLHSAHETDPSLAAEAPLFRYTPREPQGGRQRSSRRQSLDSQAQEVDDWSGVPAVCPGPSARAGPRDGRRRAEGSGDGTRGAREGGREGQTDTAWEMQAAPWQPRRSARASLDLGAGVRRPEGASGAPYDAPPLRSSMGEGARGLWRDLEEFENLGRGKKFSSLPQPHARQGVGAPEESGDLVPVPSGSTNSAVSRERPGPRDSTHKQRGEQGRRDPWQAEEERGEEARKGPISSSSTGDGGAGGTGGARESGESPYRRSQPGRGLLAKKEVDRGVGQARRASLDLGTWGTSRGGAAGTPRPRDAFSVFAEAPESGRVHHKDTHAESHPIARGSGGGAGGAPRDVFAEGLKAANVGTHRKDSPKHSRVGSRGSEGAEEGGAGGAAGPADRERRSPRDPVPRDPFAAQGRGGPGLVSRDPFAAQGKGGPRLVSRDPFAAEEEGKRGPTQVGLRPDRERVQDEGKAVRAGHKGERDRGASRRSLDLSEYSSQERSTGGVPEGTERGARGSVGSRRSLDVGSRGGSSGLHGDAAAAVAAATNVGARTSSQSATGAAAAAAAGAGFARAGAGQAGRTPGAPGEAGRGAPGPEGPSAVTAARHKHLQRLQGEGKSVLARALLGPRVSGAGLLNSPRPKNSSSNNTSNSDSISGSGAHSELFSPGSHSPGSSGRFETPLSPASSLSSPGCETDPLSLFPPSRSQSQANSRSQAQSQSQPQSQAQSQSEAQSQLQSQPHSHLRHRSQDSLSQASLSSGFSSGAQSPVRGGDLIPEGDFISRGDFTTSASASAMPSAHQLRAALHRVNASSDPLLLATRAPVSASGPTGTPQGPRDGAGASTGIPRASSGSRAGIPREPAASSAGEGPRAGLGSQADTERVRSAGVSRDSSSLSSARESQDQSSGSGARAEPSSVNSAGGDLEAAARISALAGGPGQGQGQGDGQGQGHRQRRRSLDGASFKVAPLADADAVSAEGEGRGEGGRGSVGERSVAERSGVGSGGGAGGGRVAGLRGSLLVPGLPRSPQGSPFASPSRRQPRRSHLASPSPLSSAPAVSSTHPSHFLPSSSSLSHPHTTPPHPSIPSASTLRLPSTGFEPSYPKSRSERSSAGSTGSSPDSSPRMGRHSSRGSLQERVREREWGRVGEGERGSGRVSDRGSDRVSDSDSDRGGGRDRERLAQRHTRGSSGDSTGDPTRHSTRDAASASRDQGHEGGHSRARGLPAASPPFLQSAAQRRLPAFSSPLLSSAPRRGLSAASSPAQKDIAEVPHFKKGGSLDADAEDVLGFDSTEALSVRDAMTLQVPGARAKSGTTGAGAGGVGAGVETTGVPQGAGLAPSPKGEGALGKFKKWKEQMSADLVGHRRSKIGLLSRRESTGGGLSQPVSPSSISRVGSGPWPRADSQDGAAYGNARASLRGEEPQWGPEGSGSQEAHQSGLTSEEESEGHGTGTGTQGLRSAAKVASASNPGNAFKGNPNPHSGHPAPNPNSNSHCGPSAISASHSNPRSGQSKRALGPSRFAGAQGNVSGAGAGAGAGEGGMGMRSGKGKGMTSRGSESDLTKLLGGSHSVKGSFDTFDSGDGIGGYQFQNAQEISQLLRPKGRGGAEGEGQGDGGGRGGRGREWAQEETQGHARGHRQGARHSVVESRDCAKGAGEGMQGSNSARRGEKLSFSGGHGSLDWPGGGVGLDMEGGGEGLGLGVGVGVGVGGVRGLNFREFVLGRKYEDVRNFFALHRKELGSGQFGVIRKCKELATGRIYACKTIHKSSITCAEDAEDVRREVSCLMMLRQHPSVVTLRRTFEDAESIHIVMDLMKGGDLLDRIQAKGQVSEAECARICRSMVEALLHCHCLGILHRDIKPENILLKSHESDSDIKLVDFGVATFFQPGKDLKEVIGTPEYMAPEVVEAKPYGPAADIWSAGVVLYVALSGIPPFWASSRQTLAECILNKDVSFKSAKWAHASPECKDLITKMLIKDPRHRISATEILSHPWVKEHCED